MIRTHHSLDGMWRLHAGCGTTAAAVTLAGRSEWASLEELDAWIKRYQLRLRRPRQRAYQANEYVLVDARGKS